MIKLPSNTLGGALVIMLGGIIPPLLYAAWIHSKYPDIAWKSYLEIVVAPFALWGVLANAVVIFINSRERMRLDLGIAEGKRLEEIDKEMRALVSAALADFSSAATDIYRFVHSLGQGVKPGGDFDALLENARSAKKHYPVIRLTGFVTLWDEFEQTAAFVHSKLGEQKRMLGLADPTPEQLRAVYKDHDKGIYFGTLKLRVDEAIKSMRQNSGPPDQEGAAT